MTPDQLKQGAIVRGPLFPEPVQVITTIPIGASLKLIGAGVKTNQTYQPILTSAQIAQPQVNPDLEPFDGDARKFRLGVEAVRLGLAYEYDPYFSLSIARVDPLPHQLEAVYEYFLKLPRIRFLLADATKRGDGHYEPFNFEMPLNSLEVEISEDVCILTREAAMAYREAVKAAATGAPPVLVLTGAGDAPGVGAAPGQTPVPIPSDETPAIGQTDFLRKLTWSGEIPPKLWINFYTKVLSKHATDSSLKLKVTFESSPTSGISKEKIEETRTALKELGLGGGELKSE